MSERSSSLHSSKSNSLECIEDSFVGVVISDSDDSECGSDAHNPSKINFPTVAEKDEHETSNDSILSETKTPAKDEHETSNDSILSETKTPTSKQDSFADSFSILSIKKKTKPLISDSESDCEAVAENRDSSKVIEKVNFVTPKHAEEFFERCSSQPGTPSNIKLTPENKNLYQGKQFLTPRTINTVTTSKSPSPQNFYTPNSDFEISIHSDSEEDIINDSYENEVESPIKNMHNSSPLKTMQSDPWPQAVIECTQTQYNTQLNVLKETQRDVEKLEKILKTVNLVQLPDKGKALNVRLDSLKTKLTEEETKLERMIITRAEPATQIRHQQLNWEKIHATTGQVQPQTFGKQAMKTFMQQKLLTEDCLNNLHGSLESCPDESTIVDTPKGLRIDLMPHQKRALAWLSWREKQKPSGGILADDMGLGKTLTLISLVIKSKVEAEENHSSSESDTNEENDPDIRHPKKAGGTLVVCPASLINQWEAEVNKHCKRGLLNVEVYHGAKRDPRVRRLARYDIVVTTYALTMSEYNKEGPLFGVKWRRVILDEAHVVRNYKSQTSIAVCHLAAKSRWALTGTPVHNKELDIFALIKFLRCAPFDDLHVWKRWVNNKNAGGQDRLNAVIASIMLRRTKEQLQLEGALQSLPSKNLEVIEVKLDKDEMKVYQKIMIFSRSLFAQFLHQREEKNIDLQYSGSRREDPTFMRVKDPNGEYLKMHQKILQQTNTREVQSHEILMLLLRLRQICCHPHLITKMLEGTERNLNGSVDDDDNDEEHDVHDDLLAQLEKLNLDDESGATMNPNTTSAGATDGTFAESAGRVLNPANPVFERERCSSKITKMMDVLKEKVLTQNEKAIIVSQWTSLLHLVAIHLQNEEIHFEQLDGTVPVNKRMLLVNNFNDPKHRTRVLLLSLTAGGVGLNLIGGNHLMLMDLHWNPQLESQAQDRIYRVGQQRPVHVYKFMTLDTIEERIKALQDFKLQLAEAVLTGSKITNANKLSIEDLKMLFNM